tara:strand:+ start:4952 stop:5527 length:576 start_codon:yes stop_codon:yes gene_type:complete
MRYDLILGLYLGCVSATSMAETEQNHEGEHREFEAHEHGVAELNWVMEGQELSLSLHSPAVNMLGFEHRPQNEYENQQLSLLMTTLSNPDKLIELTGGQCILSSANITNPFAVEVSDEKFDHGSSEESDHQHNDIIVEYNFLCQQPLQLETLNIKLFDTFAGFELIHAQWIINDIQGGAAFNHDNHLLKVR